VCEFMKCPKKFTSRKFSNMTTNCENLHTQDLLYFLELPSKVFHIMSTFFHLLYDYCPQIVILEGQEW